MSTELHQGLALLRQALTQLTEHCGGMYAAVVDEGNALWATGHARTTSDMAGAEKAADRFYRNEIAPRALDMRRGATLSVQVLSGPDLYIAESFAALYVVVVWFGDEFAPELARAHLLRELPRIEAITLSLPPIGGPGNTAGAASMA
jgi:hypothetical protein